MASPKGMNYIAESQVPEFLAGKDVVGLKECNKNDPCVCIDGIDWEIAVYANGVLSHDPIKKADKIARQAAEKAAAAQEMTERRSKLARIAELKLKAALTKDEESEAIRLLLQLR